MPSQSETRRQLLEALQNTTVFSGSYRDCVRNQDVHRDKMRRFGSEQIADYLASAEAATFSVVNLTKPHAGIRRRTTGASDYGEMIRRLEKIVQKQGEELAVHSAILQDLVGDSSVETGPFEKWKASPAARKFAGKHVAFLPSKGAIIASSNSLAELFDELDKLDPKNETVVGLVPG